MKRLAMKWINPLAKSSQIFDIWQMNELKNLRKHYVVLGPHWAHHQSYGQLEVEKMLEIPETNRWYFKRCNETAKVICEKPEKPLLFDVMFLALESLFLLIILSIICLRVMKILINTKLKEQQIICQ
jgi:hypothetical protein